MDYGISQYITVSHIVDAVEAQKLDILCGGVLFEKNYHTLKNCVTPYRISHTCTFTCYTNTLIQEGTPSLKRQSSNDSLLMDNFIKLGVKG